MPPRFGGKPTAVRELDNHNSGRSTMGWQMKRPDTPNDHPDAAYDAGIVDKLTDLYGASCSGWSACRRRRHGRRGAAPVVYSSDAVIANTLPSGPAPRITSMQASRAGSPHSGAPFRDSATWPAALTPIRLLCPCPAGGRRY